MSARPTCYVCGSPELASDADLRSPTCASCLPARDHVVSMQTAPDGGALAVCQCGWESNSRGERRMMVSDVKVRMHWRDVIRRVAAEYDHCFGVGSARRELVFFASMLPAIFCLIALGAAMVGEPGQ